MEAVRKAMKYYGKGVGLHWYYWHNHRFDTKYPEYFPEKAGFKEMIKETQELGGFITPYINFPYVNVSENKMTNTVAVEYNNHTIFGYSSLQDEEWLPDVAKEIILFHHERIDGSGYPFQHKGDRLKSEVKLVSICDDFDSMISGIGSEKMKIYEAIEYIKVHSGVKYDPTIASKFLDSVAAYPVGCTVYTSDGEKAVVIRQNKEAADRPVIRMTEHADGTPYTENVEYNLLKQLTMFIVDTE